MGDAPKRSRPTGEECHPTPTFLWYGAAVSQDEPAYIAVFVFDEEAGAADAREFAKRTVRADDISGVLVAQNVAVLLLPPATPDDRRRALRAVKTLRNER